ncbi:MAG: SDR family NAD(P)-dependent oxidoreductase [Limibacillus sp.]|jgi:short-subunit dehydrogenase
MRLDGKLALITGAGSGIGRALALEAAGRGMRLILTGRQKQPLEETATLAGPGSRIEIHPADVSDGAQRHGLAERAEAGGGLDVLVNNAGQLCVGPFESESDEALARMISVNLTAPILLTKEVLPQLSQAKGAVLNVGSMFGDIAFPCFAAYSATKFGLRGFSEALRRELSDSGVQVTYGAPRATRTEAADRFAHLVDPFQMKMDSPERVAAWLWDAVEQGRNRAYPGVAERLATIAQKLVPGLVDGVLTRQARAAVRSAPKAERTTV